MFSFIIVNWNGRSLLQKCIESIYAQSVKDFEIILVDNASEDDSVDFVRKEFPEVRLVCLGENRGFAGGNCAGLRYAKGEVIALLNTDAYLHEDWILAMDQAFASDQQVGICASRLIVPETGLIDSAGDALTTAFTCTKEGEFESPEKFAQDRYVTAACAAAAVYRRDMIDEIGFFDEDFFLILEDSDLSFRARLQGWKCLFVADAVAYHQVSSTIGAMSDLSVYYFSRNSEFLWLKNVPLWGMVRYAHIRMVYQLMALFYFCILKRKARPYLKGKVDAYLCFLPNMRKRKFIQAGKKLDNLELFGELIPYKEFIFRKFRTLR